VSLNNRERIITLTDRPPISIIEDEWPELATGSVVSRPTHGAHHSTWIRARVHGAPDERPVISDGEPATVLVYATHDWAAPGEDRSGDRRVRVGVLVDLSVPPDEPLSPAVAPLIVQVGALLRDRGVPEHIVRDVVAATVADLPPVAL
jgi:hypothetical protein